MSDLIAFLNARLDEDEAAAKVAADRSGSLEWQHAESADGRDVIRMGDDETFGAHAALAAHIARHDPARALRDVASKRAMLAELTRYPFDYRPDCDDPIRLFVRLLAAVWSDHPDYDESWKP